MPVYDPDLRVELRMMGIDPDQAEDVIEKPQEQSVSARPSAITTKPSSFGSAVRSFARGLPSAAGAISGGAAGGKIGAGIGTMVAPGIGTAIGGGAGLIGGGILGALGAGAAQNAVINNVLPTEMAEAYREQERIDREVNSLASTIGGAGASIIGLRLDPRAIVGAGRAVRDLVTPGIRTHAADLGNLANVGLGAAIPATARAVLDPNASVSDVIAEGAMGSILNNPNRLAQRIGLTPNTYRAPAPSLDEIPPQVTQQLLEEFEKLGAFRGAETTLQPVVDPITGAEAAGRVLARQNNTPAQIQLNPAAMGVDTPAHEVAHTYADDLTARGNTGEQRLVSDARGRFGDEGMVDRVSVDLLRRMVKSNQGIRNWLKDFTAGSRQALGSASDEDLVRVLSNKLLNDPSFNEAFNARLTPKTGTVGEQISEQQRIAQEYEAQALPQPKDKPAYPTAEEVSARRQAEFEAAKAEVEAGEAQIQQNVQRGQEKRLAKLEQKQAVAEAKKIDSAGLVMKSPAENQPRPLATTETGKDIYPDYTGVQEADIAANQMRLADAEWLQQLFDNAKYQRQPQQPNATPNPLFSGKPVSATAGATAGATPSTGTSSGTSGPAPRTPPVGRGEIFAPVLKPVIDRVEALGTPKAKEFAGKAREFADVIKRHRGKLVNPFVRNMRELGDLSLLKNPKNYAMHNSKDFEKVYDYLEAVNAGTPLPALSAKQKLILDEHRKGMKAVHDELVKRPGINAQPPPFNPNQLVETPSPEVIKTLTKKPNSPEAQKLRDDMINHIATKRGTSLADAEKEYTTFISSFGNPDVDLAFNFEPLDAPGGGIGLPRSWHNKNLMEADSRYLDRASRRFAAHDTFEQLADYKKTIDELSINEDVRAVVRDVKGARLYDEPLLAATGGLVRAAMLGTATGVYDVTASPFLGWQHQGNPISAAKRGIEAWAKIKDGWIDSFDAGRNKQDLQSLEMDSGAEVVSMVRRARQALTDLSGRNFLEQVSRAHSMMVGELTAQDFFREIKSGKPSDAAKRFFASFGKDVDTTKAALNRDDLLNLAGRYVDSVQGAYDFTGLPRFAMEGQLSPVFSLSRWSIEKTNNFFKHTLTPALQGDIKPLLMSTLGMLVGGAAVTEVREAISQRKTRTAELKELKAAAEAGYNTAPDWAYKLAGMAAAAGHAGMFMDLAKSAMDYTYGKNRPQPFNNALLEFSENVGTLIGDMVASINEEGLNPEVFIEAMGRLVEENLQTGRLLMQYTSAEKQEDIERANKFRDLRVYKTLAGDDIADMTSPFRTPMTGDDMRRFKRTDDPQEAIALLPDLITRAIERAGNDPEKLKREISKIKRNSYQTMPDPERVPMSFYNYYQFLARSQGDEVAAERMADFFSQKQLNQAKSGMLGVE